MIAKHEKLIEDLLQKTESGAARWEPSDSESQVALKLKKGVILLDKQRLTVASGAVTDYKFTILDSEGNAIEQIRPEGSFYRSKAGRLFDTAKRQIAKIDDKLADIIGEIEALR
jgi:hypothetical protein